MLVEGDEERINVEGNEEGGLMEKEESHLFLDLLV